MPIPRHLLAELKQWREADSDGAALVCPAPRDPKRPITPEGVARGLEDRRLVAKRLELRRRLMQWYESELIAARDGAQIVRLSAGSSAST